MPGLLFINTIICKESWCKVFSVLIPLIYNCLINFHFNRTRKNAFCLIPIRLCLILALLHSINTYRRTYLTLGVPRRENIILLIIGRAEMDVTNDTQLGNRNECDNWD